MQPLNYVCSWSRHRIVRGDKTPARLLKVCGPATGLSRLTLRSAAGREIGRVNVPSGAPGRWHFGFWVPESLPCAGPYILDCEKPEGLGKTRVALKPGRPGQGDEFPLRLDFTGEKLRDHLQRREQIPDARLLAGFVPDMKQYLKQHRIIFLSPADHWSEGLVLGNGAMGAIVTGERGRSQTFYLDRCDLWAASPKGLPYGRFYGGILQMRYALNRDNLGASHHTKYLQELSLHSAEAATSDGPLQTVARVNAEHDALEISILWNGSGPLRVELELSRKAMPLPENNLRQCEVANGSWEAITPCETVANARRSVASLPHSRPRVAVAGRVTVIKHDLPNIKTCIAATVSGVPATWRDRSQIQMARSVAAFLVKPGKKALIFVALTSSRGDGRPQDAAIGTLNRLSAAEPADPGNNDGHRLWWDRFWRRSFIELPDKLMENMWYFGAYLQASFSRSLEASGFFGPWHPLDHRTWLDCHTADAQTALLWWAPFATNHMELMLPSHNTFAGLLPFFMAFNPGKGALVPHQFAPAWAGGAAFFGRPNPYKGSIAWFALNFWNDFLLTRDRKFLSGIAYPVIAACADFHAADLVRGRDGLLHCRNSSSPEQADTANDNVYDRACIGAVLRAAVSAAGILGAEPRRARRWEDALRDLYDFPADTASLIETKDNPHPYRCHPTVLFGIHPTGEIEPGSPLWKKADETYGIVTNLFGFHYEDRHNAIPGHRGGQEPNGHATAFLMHAAARLRGWREVRRLFYALTVRTQLKPNGQLSICDPRHDRRLTNMAICEATSGQTSGITEALLQNYSDHARVFPNMNSGGVFRFAGLRARGGFILAGERARGRTNFLVVHSLCGGKLRLLNPWPGRKPLADPAAPMALARLADGNEALEISTTPGSTFRISCGEPGRAPAPAVENRRGPRAVVCGDWTDYSPPVVYYPEDLPFAQETGGARVFLGRPAAKPRPRRDAPASWARITAMTRDKEWQARQTAARWLAAVPSERAIKLLIKMARRDPKPVVRYTAGVSLVRHSSPAGLRAALAIARATGALPHLRREIEKAINRRSRRLSLNTDSVWRARDCSGAINRETKRRST